MEQLLLFEELSLRAGDIINGKGKRLYSKDIYKGLHFVQDHSGTFVICKVKDIGNQITYSDGGYDLNYTRPEYIDREGKGFESTLFYAIPENFIKQKERWI